MSEQLQDAVREWHEARLQFCGAVKDSKGLVPKPFWNRLADAEYALAQFARNLPSKD